MGSFYCSTSSALFTKRRMFFSFLIIPFDCGSSGTTDGFSTAAGEVATTVDSSSVGCPVVAVACASCAAFACASCFARYCLSYLTPVLKTIELL